MNYHKRKKILMFVLGAILLAGFFSFLPFDFIQGFTKQVSHVSAQTAPTIQDATGLTQVGEATALGKDDIRVTIAKIIRVILGLLGIAALVIMLYGGYIYMTAAGEEQKISTAKKIILNGVIGLVIILSSFAITQFILNKLAEGTGFGGGAVPAACADPVYAAANPAICSSGGYNSCDNLDNQFVVKSITPSVPAGSIAMNNFAVRVIFSQGVDLTGITAADVFIISRGGSNVNSEFTFAVLDAPENKIIEAVSVAPLSDGGNYTVTVLSTLTSTGGLNLETSNTCGTFANNASFGVSTTGVTDSQAPTVSTITYSGLTYGGVVALPRGKTYRIGSAITDDFGAGYVRLQVQRLDVNNLPIGSPVVFYDGPRIARGSEATAANPYNFNYNYLVSANTPLYNEIPDSKFRVTLTATDIDHNQTTVSSDFIIVESSCAFGTGQGDDPGCRGNGSCTADFQCLSGVCDETSGQCLNIPLITDVSPWSQAGGSWVTIMGDSFGTSPGSVQFGRDGTIPADGVPDIWVSAPLASCGGTDVWHNNYIIVEVPDDIAMPDNSFSSIRVEHEAYNSATNPDFYDESADNRGPLGGPNAGWFKKDNSLSLPGLCNIAPSQGAPGVTNVTVLGQKLGGSGTLAFGNIAAATSGWTDAQINATVPENMAFGTVGVVATVGAKQSNGLPFKVVSPASLTAPLIESVTPANTTVGSYITIAGQRFGENPGVVYLAPNATTNCPGTTCLLMTTVLPAACGDTWNNGQIIAQVPVGATGQKTVIVENEFGLQSVPGTADILNIIVGGPMPSICALSPAKGMAPVENAESRLTITGINFSNSPRIYFWGQESTVTDNTKWLSLLSRLSILGSDNYIYLTAGNYNDGFYRYSISDNTWVQLRNVPSGTRWGSQMIRNGNDDTIYLVPGNNFNYFFSYSIEDDVWTDLRNLPMPAGMGTQMIRNGSDDAIYLAAGLTNGFFYRYSIASNTWTPLSQAGQYFNISTKMIRNGGDDDIFVIPSNDTRNFYHYSISNNAWTALDPIPSPNGASYGTQMIRNGGDDYIYVLPGNNYNLYRYSIKDKIWTDLVTLPYMYHGSKMIRNGAEDYIYLMPGNNSSQFLRYSISQDTLISLQPAPSGVFYGSQMIRNGAEDTIYLSPGAGGSGDNLYSYSINSDTWTTNLSKIPVPGNFGLMNAGSQMIRYNSGITSSAVETILTGIPVDYAGYSLPSNPLISSSGFSMRSGPIKVKSVIGQESNSVKYTVDDCREIAKSRWPDDMRCCATGTSAGNFIHESFVCPGEKRYGGYVWRFTTGKIAKLPRVLEECDLVGTGTPPAPPIISPTPWRYQGNGGNICLNAQISVDFNIDMDPLTFANRVRIFTTTTGYDFADATEVSVALPAQGAANSLVIRSSGVPANLSPNTWYRVVLLRGIKSIETVDVLGVATILRQDLLRSRVCDMDLDNDGTNDKDMIAYCFDFKTGPAGSECVLESAGVKPSEHSVDTLGPVKKGGNDLVYEVWGRGDQACSVISVDKLLWDWNAFDMPSGIGNLSANVAYLSPTRRSLAKAMALKQPINPNTHVELQASVVTTGQTITGSSILNINLGPPKVTEYWPSCGAACVNAVIGAKFSRMMDPSTYAGNIRLYECPSENACINAIANNSVVGLTQVTILPPDIASRFETQFVPDANLTPDTSYLVYFTSGIYSVGQLDANNNIVRRGVPLQAKMWQFKTKVDSGVCIADKVITKPDPFTAYFVREKTKYAASPYTNPDECSAAGQALNPWDFGWNWSSADNNVAIVSNFATAGKMKSFCNAGCLPKGADIASGSYNVMNNEPWLCGNGTVDPGEDCDIGAFGEVAGTSCALDCQRPGNNNSGTGAGQCDNGIIDIAQGEECDGGPSGKGVGCSASTTPNYFPCLHLGSTDDPAQASVGQPLCGSGAVTVGEDCEPGLNGEIEGVTCSSNCLHIGTRTAQAWCDANLTSENTAACKMAASVCGNGSLERGEECEYNVGGNGKVLVLTEFGNYTSLDATDANCSANCLLQDICSTDIVGNTELACDPSTGLEGCNTDCTLHGSSADEYIVSSLCGDAVVGAGEFGVCEYTPAELTALDVDLADNNPFQVVTALGGGTLNTDGNQSTQIISSITSIRAKGAASPRSILGTPITDNSDYTLQCGFTEFATNVAPFNDCPTIPGSSDLFGVGNNSCCYVRPERTDAYPADASGLSGGPSGAVCRNTAIFVTFNGDIDEATLINNLVLARGYVIAPGMPNNPTCSSPDKDITADLRATLALNDFGNSLENNGGIWNNIWNSVKKIFAWVIEKAKASIVSDSASGIGLWCETDLAGIPEVVKTKDADGNVTQSTANVYLAGLLDVDSTYAVFMRGGKTGIKDTKGVGILDDSLVFRTGADICRIGKVIISNRPSVYTAPMTAQNVSAFAQTTDGKLINPITGIYDWTWSWGPLNNPIFTINNVTTPANTISSTNLEGKRVGRANVIVTADISSAGNQLGQVFTGNIDLTSVFCENPWPLITNYPYEDGISAESSATVNVNNDGTNQGVFDGSMIPGTDTSPFNFRMSYCADDGKQANKTDDLPYLRPFVFTSGFPDASSDLGTLKKFLFFNETNNDAIGIQVFKNTARYSTAKWFTNKGLGNAQGFKAVSIDGYDALTDGNNYYINALNVVGANSYNNIYLFSINKEAQDSTRKVFDKLIDSLEFNINFTDNQYCASDPTIACTVDYDCADKNGEPLVSGGTVDCDADKTKMRRDWDRILTLADAQEKLGALTTKPKLASGTYIPGETRSVWPSWGNLGSQVGGIGSDPLNTWTSCSYCSNNTVAPLTICSSDEDCNAGGSTGNTCISIDSQTCWDDINNRFICPRMENIIGYKLQANGDYTLYSPLEYFTSANIGGFLDTTNNHFENSDVLCAAGAGTVISPTSGVCGNGVINTGEDCDPPGQVIVSSDLCASSATSIGLYAYICGASCTLGPPVCQQTNTCGNSRIEPGETCDEGRLNGSYGHCNGSCSGFSNQFCGNGAVDKHCSNNIASPCFVNSDCGPASDFNTCVPSEVCDSGSVLNGVYGSGCAADCQSAGSRCGDGILQSGDGEQCDDSNNVPTDGCNNCQIVLATTPPVSANIPVGCGDKKIDSGEACDNGAGINGIACTPKYGEYCNYCSFDCGEVLYIEPAGFCGNQQIDFVSKDPNSGVSTAEVCEYIPPALQNNVLQGPWIRHSRLPTSTLDIITFRNIGVSSQPPPPNIITTLVDECKAAPGVWVPPQGSIPAIYTTKTGTYKCKNSCSTYEKSCTTCGNALVVNGGVRPRLSVINPMVGVDVNTSPWFTALSVKFLMRDGNTMNLFAGKPIIYDTTAESPKKIYGNETEPPVNLTRNVGILTNPICNDIYKDHPVYNVCFNGGDPLCVTTPQSLLPYYVNSETSYVDNDYIISPNPPEGSIRVVVKWKAKDMTALSNGGFGLGMINTSSDVGDKTYFSAQSQATLCRVINQDPVGTGYWIPSCVGWHGTRTVPMAIFGGQGAYMHNQFNLIPTSTAKTFVQSMTVNLYDSPTPTTPGSFITAAPFAIYVEAKSANNTGIPMNNLLKTEAEVLVFKHHPIPPETNGVVGQTTDTVFKPDHIFPIKLAQKSSNPGARYWHVFNIEKTNDAAAYGYNIVQAQKVRTDTASLVTGAVSPLFVEGVFLPALPAYLFPVCGDGILTPPENCDDSPAGSNDGGFGHCSLDCTYRVDLPDLSNPIEEVTGGGRGGSFN